MTSVSSTPPAADISPSATCAAITTTAIGRLRPSLPIRRPPSVGSPAFPTAALTTRLPSAATRENPPFQIQMSMALAIWPALALLARQRWSADQKSAPTGNVAARSTTLTRGSARTRPIVVAHRMRSSTSTGPAGARRHAPARPAVPTAAAAPAESAPPALSARRTINAASRPAAPARHAARMAAGPRVAAAPPE